MNGTHRLAQVPPGVQCFVGGEVRRRRRIEETVVSVFEGWDYEEIIPPLFDYADVFASEALAPKTYSFVGRDGNVLALRPDFTSLLAKIAAGRLRDRKAPLRLYYSGEVVRYEPVKAGRLRDRKAPLRLYYSGEVVRYEPVKAGRQSELHQMGLEHLGGEARAADAEVLAIAAESLERLGVRGFVLAVGHVGVFNGLVQGAALDAERLEALRERVESKDPAGVRRALEGMALPATTAASLEQLTAMAGGLETLDGAGRAFASCPAAAAAVEELRALTGTLRAAGLADRLAVDLGEVRGLDYYTGLVFRVFAPGLGFEVGGGGRYDTLLARFGRPLPAVGFMLGLDRVALLLERQGRFPAAAPSPAVPVRGADLGVALAEARAKRAAGLRVRFGTGGPA
jgi:ATP phosphoribosyltransferase regulatory subunit